MTEHSLLEVHLRSAHQPGLVFLRNSLAAYLRETADGVDTFSAEQLHARLKKVGRLVAVIEDFES